MILRYLTCFSVLFSLIFNTGCSSAKKEEVGVRDQPATQGQELEGPLPAKLIEGYNYVYQDALAPNIIPTVKEAMAGAATPVTVGKWVDGVFDFDQKLVYLDTKKIARSYYKVYEVSVEKGKTYKIQFQGIPSRANAGVFDQVFYVLFPVIQVSDPTIVFKTTQNVFEHSMAKIRMRVTWEFVAQKSQQLKIFVASSTFEKAHPQHARLKEPNQFHVLFPGGKAGARSVTNPVYYGTGGALAIIGATTARYTPLMDVAGEYEFRVDD